MWISAVQETLTAERDFHRQYRDTHHQKYPQLSHFYPLFDSEGSTCPAVRGTNSTKVRVHIKCGRTPFLREFEWGKWRKDVLLPKNCGTVIANTVKTIHIQVFQFFCESQWECRKLWKFKKWQFSDFEKSATSNTTYCFTQVLNHNKIL